MDAWRDIEQMINMIKDEYRPGASTEFSATAEIFSIADFWKKKLEQERDTLKLLLLEKKDALEELNSRYHEVHEKNKQLEAANKHIAAQHHRDISVLEQKEQEITRVHEEVVQFRSSIEALRSDVVHGDERQQEDKKVFMQHIDAMKTEYQKLVSSFQEREKSLSLIVADKRKAEDQLADARKIVSRLREKEHHLHREVEGQAKSFSLHMRDMLTIISGKIQIACTKFKMNDKALDLLDGVNVNITHLSSVLDEYLFLSAMPELNLKPVEINTLIGDVLRLMQERVAHAGCVLKMNCARELPPIRIDQGFMTDCIVNIMQNAIEASSGGGSIMVSSGRNINQHSVYIMISCIGQHFSPAVLENACKPYFTTRQGHRGMGLTIAKRIVELHGGTIQLDNNSRLGASVTITLHEYYEK